jgi:hypothetical protein
MRKIILSIVFITAAHAAHAQTAPTTSSMSCPAGYALDVGQPTPLPPDDPNQPPKMALEQQQEDQQAMAEQFAHWQCVPMNGTAPSGATAPQ